MFRSTTPQSRSRTSQRGLRRTKKKKKKNKKNELVKKNIAFEVKRLDR